MYTMDETRYLEGALGWRQPRKMLSLAAPSCLNDIPALLLPARCANAGGGCCCFGQGGSRRPGPQNRVLASRSLANLGIGIMHLLCPWKTHKPKASQTITSGLPSRYSCTAYRRHLQRPALLCMYVEATTCPCATYESARRVPWAWVRVWVLHQQRKKKLSSSTPAPTFPTGYKARMPPCMYITVCK